MCEQRSREVELRLGSRLRHAARAEDRRSVPEQLLCLGREPRIPEHLGAVHVADRFGDG